MNSEVILATDLNPDRWMRVARSGDFLTLAAETAAASKTSIQGCLWHARALRALGRGTEANAILESFAHEKKLEGRAADLAEIGEEYLQCQLFKPAARIAATLEREGIPQAHYLWLSLWRERERWSDVERVSTTLKAFGAPWDTLATIQIIWALLRQGKTEKAAELFDSAKLPRQHPAILKLASRVALARGEWMRALETLEHVKPAQPLDWEWRGLAAIATSGRFAETRERRLIEQAEGLFTASLNLQPRQAELLINRARFELVLGKSEAAEKDLLQALSIKPWADSALLLRIQILRSSGRSSEAATWLAEQRRALDNAERASAALDLKVYAGAKPEEIKAAAHALTAKFGADAAAWRTAGAALQRIKKLDEAVKHYEKALSLDPADNATLNNLAILYGDRGDIEQAVRALAQLDFASDTSIHLNYALLCLQIGELDEAESHLHHLSARMPQHAGVLRGLAELALSREDIVTARSLAERALAFDRVNPLAWQTLAAAVKILEGDKAALALLRKGEVEAQPVLSLHKTMFAVARRVLSVADLRALVNGWCVTYPEEVQYRLMAADVDMEACDFEGAQSHLTASRALDEEAGGSALMSFYLARERYGAAETIGKQLVRTFPTAMKHWGGLAEVFYLQRKPERALATLDEGLAIEPDRLSLVRQKAGIMLALERFADAVRLAAQFDQRHATMESLQFHLDVLRRARRYSEQCAVLEAAVQSSPNHILLQSALAEALEQTNRRDEALAKWEELERLHPRNFSLLQKQVQALIRVDRIADAVARINRYVADEDPAPALAVALADLLRKDGLLEDARAVLDKASARNSGHLGLMLQRTALEKRCDAVDAERACWLDIMARHPVWQWFEEGLQTIVRLGLDAELEKHLNQWRTQEPESHAPWWAAFRAARALKRPAVAERILNKIASLKGAPSADIVIARVDMWSEGWRLSDSILELQQALALWPTRTDLIERLINANVKAGIFETFDDLFQKLKHLLGDKQYAHYPSFFFNINCHPDWSEQQVSDFYRQWYQHAVKGKIVPPAPFKQTKERDRRLRIGYLSPDFRRHAVAYFSEPLLRSHDRTQFENFAYAHLDPGQADAYTERFKTYVHHWIDTRGMGDGELARRIRDDQIDILIDLAGHTTNNRLGVMMLRPAPVQASWIFGAGQTTGIPEVGHLLTDELIIPATSDRFYAEKVIRLPIQGLPFLPAHDALQPTSLPSLENGFVTFGVVARPVRISQRTLSVWGEILLKVPSSVIRFDHVPYVEPDVQQRLRTFFASRGVDEKRIEFRNSRPHWQAYQNIDIQLDPFPAGSGTTVSEGLYMERLPITLRARPPMGRVPAAQIEALGLADVCVADTESEYVEKATRLALDINRLSELSTGLRGRLERSPLMDYEAYGAAAAQAYRNMWATWCGSASSTRGSSWG